jgi:hypothetical protein
MSPQGQAREYPVLNLNNKYVHPLQSQLAREWWTQPQRNQSQICNIRMIILFPILKVRRDSIPIREWDRTMGHSYSNMHLL